MQQKNKNFTIIRAVIIILIGAITYSLLYYVAGFMWVLASESTTLPALMVIGLFTGGLCRILQARHPFIFGLLGTSLAFGIRNVLTAYAQTGSSGIGTIIISTVIIGFSLAFLIVHYVKSESALAAAVVVLFLISWFSPTYSAQIDRYMYEKQNGSIY